VGVNVNTFEPKLGIAAGAGAEPALSRVGLAAGSKVKVAVTVSGPLAAFESVTATGALLWPSVAVELAVWVTGLVRTTPVIESTRLVVVSAPVLPGAALLTLTPWSELVRTVQIPLVSAAGRASRDTTTGKVSDWPSAMPPLAPGCDKRT